jgi:hypothetical protein
MSEEYDPAKIQRAALEVVRESLGLPENPEENEDDPSVLWAEIHRLRAEVQGPHPHATWKDAAIAERMHRVVAEKKLVILRTALQNELDLVELNAQTFTLLETEMKITAIPAARIRTILDIPMAQPAGLLPPTNEVDETDPDNVPEVGSIWQHRKGDYYTVRGMTSQPDPEKADKFPRTVFYQGPDGRRWTRTLESWMDSFKLIVPPTNIAGELKKDDMRVMNGVIWYCTNPEIDRWVSQGELPDFTSSTTAADAFALSDTSKEFINTRQNFFPDGQAEEITQLPQPIEGAPKEVGVHILGIDAQSEKPHWTELEWDGKGWEVCGISDWLPLYSFPTHFIPLPDKSAILKGDQHG